MHSITITLDEYLNEGYTLPENINDFIILEINEIEYNISDMFVKRNRYKEIGSETEELFKHNLDVLIDECLSLYNPQLKLLQDNYENLMKRTVTEEISGDGERHGSNKNYLNPANTNATKLSDKTDTDGTNEYHETRDRSFGFFKSNPEILQKANECFEVVTKILKYLDKAFIAEY